VGKLCILVALASCSPALRATGRCPTGVTLGADFAATGVLLAASAHTYNEGRAARSFSFAGAGMAIALVANVSECRP